MDAKVVCLLFVLACAVTTSCAMSLTASADREVEDLDEASDMFLTLGRFLQSLRERFSKGNLTNDLITEDGDDDDAEGDEAVFSRRRRMIGGMHRQPHGRVYRGRHRVYFPRRRTSPRLRVRPNVSPY